MSNKYSLKALHIAATNVFFLVNGYICLQGPKRMEGKETEEQIFCARCEKPPSISFLSECFFFEKPPPLKGF